MIRESRRRFLPAGKSILRRLGVNRMRAATIRMGCERRLLAAKRSRSLAPRDGGRILAYHAVGTPRWGLNDISPRRFRHQLKLALDAGFEFVDPLELVRSEGRSNQLAITFDDGLSSVLENAAPILRDLHIPWTLFIVSRWVEMGHPLFGSEMFLDWHDLERISGFGGSIGGHSATHRNFARLSTEETTQELFESRALVERRLGFAPTSFAIPFGQSADWTDSAARLAADAGYTVVYSQAEDTRFPGTVPRTKIAGTDNDFVFSAALRGAFDQWEEWT